MRRLALCMATAAAFGLAACASGGISRFTGASGKKKSVTQTDGSNGGASNSNTVTKDIDTTSVSLQVKDLQLLQSSIVSCMGPNMTAITADMLTPSDPTAAMPSLPDGKHAFLPPDRYAAGDDVIEKEKGNLVDLADGVRTSTTGDGLSDTYLRSLQTVANVVAHNCSLDNPNCQCQTKDQALAMVQRCLPAFDPEAASIQDAITTLGAVCNGSDKNAGMRTAVASFLASYAFAAAR